MNHQEIQTILPFSSFLFLASASVSISPFGVSLSSTILFDVYVGQIPRDEFQSLNRVCREKRQIGTGWFWSGIHHKRNILEDGGINAENEMTELPSPQGATICAGLLIFYNSLEEISEGFLSC